MDPMLLKIRWLLQKKTSYTIKVLFCKTMWKTLDEMLEKSSEC